VEAFGSATSLEGFAFALSLIKLKQQHLNTSRRWITDAKFVTSEPKQQIRA
jgi:hypothetical protein